MRFHFIGDRTERLFSKGQRLTDEWRYDEAVEMFDRAIRTDPEYAHIYLYKALALAEAGRYDDAVREARKGAELAPENFVFPLYLGCIHLDFDRVDAATQAFDVSSRMAPENPLVNGYQALAAYAAGDGAALLPVEAALGGLPNSFKSRLLVAISQVGDDALALTASRAASRATEGERWCRARINEWRRHRLEIRVDRLLSARSYEQIVEVLRAEMSASELGEPLHAAMQQALKRAETELMAQLDRLTERPSPSGKKRRFARRAKRRVQKQRRSVLLRLASLHESDDRKRYRDLERWVGSFHESTPATGHSDSRAAEVLAEMAEIARRTGRLDTARSLCEQSRAAGKSPEVDWIDARVSVAAGNRRVARRCLERFADSQPLLFNQRCSLVVEEALQRLRDSGTARPSSSVSG